MDIVKKSAIFIGISMLFIAFVSQAGLIVHGMDNAHQFVIDKLSMVFANGSTGIFIKQTLALLLIPIGFALVPTLVYWGFKRKPMPYFMHVLWGVWLALATSLALSSMSILN